MADSPDFAKGPSGPDPYAGGLGIAAPYLGGASAIANAAAGAGTTGTSFPAAPADAQLFTYVADGTNGVLWTFRYYLTGAYWAFVGGPPLYSEIATSETTANTGYVDLTTPGPSIVLPFAADYDVAIGTTAANNSNLGSSFMSYAIGGTAASDNDLIRFTEPGTVQGGIASLYRLRRKAGLTAVTLTAKYRVDAGTGTWDRRWMAVWPVKK